MTTLREAAQQALGAMRCAVPTGKITLYEWDKAVSDLDAALAEYDKDRVKVEEMKANWTLQRKLAEETQERDKQQREYEEQRLAALAEPVQEPVAWYCKEGLKRGVSLKQESPEWIPLYTKEKL